MNQVLGLECTICGQQYQVSEAEYICPKHGNNGILDVVYDYDLIRRRISPLKLADNYDRSFLRYLPLLPLEPDDAERLSRGTLLESVGWTPLLPVPRLASHLGLKYLWVKDDSRLPTASLKDRASAIAVVKARELASPIITAASTGNAAAALSGLCAAVSQAHVLFVPRTTPQAKIAQLMVCGAEVLLVDGTYDDAFELCLQSALEFGWYNRCTGYNPYMSEGKKTVAYEILEQLNWHGPDSVFIPVGDGCIIGAVHKGLRDMQALGWIDQVPRLMGVQAVGSASLADAWERGLQAVDMQPIVPHTLADSLSTGLPRDRIKALRAVRESGGAFIRVTDDEILAAIPAVARGCGIFPEPAAAAAYAGLVKAIQNNMVQLDDSVVVLLTGSGLKDIASAIRAVRQPPVVSPSLADVKRAMSRA